jgi:hypothetical protein
MSEEEKYDELIRQKFAEKEFMFNEANWEKAEAMIDSSRKTKKAFWWSAVFLIGLITGIFLMFPLIKNNSSPATKGQTKLNDSLTLTDSLPNGSLPDKAAADEALTAENDSFVTDPTQVLLDDTQIRTETDNISGNSDNSKTAVDELSVKNNSNISTKNESNSNASDQLRKNKFSKTSREAPASKNAQQYSKTTATVKAESCKTNKIAEVDPLNPDHIQSAEADKPSLTPQKKKRENKISTSEKEMYALTRERTGIKNAKPPVAKKSTDVKDELKEGEAKEKDSKEEVEKNATARKDASAADTPDSTLLENESAEETAAKIDALNDSVKQEEKKLVTADSVQKSDSAKVADQNKALAPALDGLAKATFFLIDAGINGQLGWKNNDVIEGRGVTPVLGLGITHAFNQTWSFSTGIHYTGIGYLKGDSKTTTATTYDFGSTTTITTTKPRFLHYASVPLTIQYHFNDKNAILAGGSVSYLLNAKSKVEENTTRVGPSIDSISVPGNTTDYYTKTFNMFDAAISVGYRRKISSRFSITGIANFGLLDIKRNSFFLQNTVERNCGLKLILSYTIFDF